MPVPTSARLEGSGISVIVNDPPPVAENVPTFVGLFEKTRIMALPPPPTTVEQLPVMALFEKTKRVEPPPVQKNAAVYVVEDKVKGAIEKDPSVVIRFGSVNEKFPPVVVKV